MRHIEIVAAVGLSLCLGLLGCAGSGTSAADDFSTTLDVPVVPNPDVDSGGLSDVSDSGDDKGWTTDGDASLPDDSSTHHDGNDADSAFDGTTLDDGACTTDPWTILAPMPSPRFGCAGAAVDTAEGVRIIVTGGYASGYLDLAEAYNPVTDTWATLAHMTHKRSLHGSVGLAGKVHVFGGFDGSETRVDHEIFDPSTGLWTDGTSMPSLRGGYATVAADTEQGTRVFIVGGYDENANSVGWTEAFNPTAGTWQTLTEMPTKRSGLALAVAQVGGKPHLFALGGALNDSLAVQNEEYDPETDQWYPRMSLPVAQSSGVAMGVGGVVYLFGGSGTSFSLDLVGVYDVAADHWTTANPLPTGRTMSAIAIADGRIHVIGGSGANRNENEAFLPSAACPWSERLGK